jgi:Leucine-rich repeat (LRR) protein
MTFKEYITLYKIPIGATTIECRDLGITDLIGINDFTNLERLDVNGNLISEIPSLENLTKLKYFYCGRNDLHELPLLSNSIPILIKFPIVNG